MTDKIVSETENRSVEIIQPWKERGKKKDLTQMNRSSGTCGRIKGITSCHQKDKHKEFSAEKCISRDNAWKLPLFSKPYKLIDSRSWTKPKKDKSKEIPC